MIALIVAGVVLALLAGAAGGIWLWLQRALKKAEVDAQKLAEAMLDKKVQKLAIERLNEWRTLEEKANERRTHILAENLAHTQFEKWKMSEETRIRQDAIVRSEAISKGKQVEHFVAFMTGFEYAPRDARFLGSPIDLVVFDGLADGNVKEVVFVEIKSGKSQLTKREQLVKDAIEQKRVSWKQIRLEDALGV